MEPMKALEPNVIILYICSIESRIYAVSAHTIVLFVEST